MNIITQGNTPQVNLTGTKLQPQNNLMTKEHSSAQIPDAGEKRANYDTVEISGTGLYAMAIPKETAELAAQNPIKKAEIAVTKNRHVGIEMTQSFNAMLQSAFETGEQKSFSYGGWQKFLNDKCVAWVKDKQANDPEMYVEWVKTSKRHIENGNPEMASLPGDFTMEDYDRIVAGEKEATRA